MPLVIDRRSAIDRATVAALLAARVPGSEFGSLRVPSYVRQRNAFEYISGEAMRVTGCELEAAVSAHMAAEARAAEVRRALDAIGECAADPTASTGEEERQAAERRLAELTKTCNAAGAKAVKLADELAAVCVEGLAAADEAAAIGERRNFSVAPPKYRCGNAAGVVGERSQPSRPPSPYQGRTEDLAKSVRQLCGVEATSQV